MLVYAKPAKLQVFFLQRVSSMLMLRRDAIDPQATRKRWYTYYGVANLIKSNKFNFDRNMGNL